MNNKKSFFTVSRNTILLLVGGFFLAGGLLNIGDNNEAAVFGVVVGIAFLVWRFLPPYLKKKEAQKQQLDEKEQKQREIETRTWSCSHCGANTRGECCEYCDSPYEERGN